MKFRNLYCISQKKQVCFRVVYALPNVICVTGQNFGLINHAHPNHTEQTLEKGTFYPHHSLRHYYVSSPDHPIPVNQIL